MSGIFYGWVFMNVLFYYRSADLTVTKLGQANVVNFGMN